MKTKTDGHHTRGFFPVVVDVLVLIDSEERHGGRAEKVRTDPEICGSRHPFMGTICVLLLPYGLLNDLLYFVYHSQTILEELLRTGQQNELELSQ